MKFDDIQSPKRGRQGRCPVCGQPTTGLISIVLDRKDPSGQNRRHRVASINRTLCEKHSIQIYQNLVNELLEKL